MAMKWYVVHTQVGCENKALTSLKERIKQMDMESLFGQMLLPAESVSEIINGQKKTTVKKFYPGYIFVQVEMTEQTYHLVRNTAKITGFLGGKKPTPVSDKVIGQINAQLSEGLQKTKIRTSFEQGEQIRVTTGPFSNLSGIIDEVNVDKQKLKVRVSIFGRSTSVELDYSQVERVV